MTLCSNALQKATISLFPQWNDPTKFTVINGTRSPVNLSSRKQNGRKREIIPIFFDNPNVAVVTSSCWFCSCSISPISCPPLTWPQDLSDVRAQSKDDDNTLQMDWACSCLDRWWKPHDIQVKLLEGPTSRELFYLTLTELLHWYTQMLHSSCFASVVLRARRFFPAPRPSS